MTDCLTMYSFTSQEEITLLEDHEKDGLNLLKGTRDSFT